jgi:uncharacterized membrane protein
MSGYRMVFWTVFTLSGIWMQSFMPGIDFLAPGLILSLQEEKIRTAVVLGLLWLLIQEGTGSLAFGTVILWYGVLTALFFFGHWLFEAKNFIFMVIIGVCLGVLHFVLMTVMAQLQDWRLILGRVFLEGVIQAVVFPVEWGLIYIIFNHLPQGKYDV